MTSILNTPYNIKHVLDLIKKIGFDFTPTFTNYKVYNQYLKLITIKSVNIKNKPFKSFISVYLKKSGRGAWFFSAFHCYIYHTNYVGYRLAYSLFYIIPKAHIKQSLRMNLQKCLSLKEIIQSLNSAINNTDHDTQTHIRFGMISELYLFSFFTEGVRQRLYLIQKREHRCEYLSGRDIEASSDVTQLIAVKRQLLINSNL